MGIIEYRWYFYENNRFSRPHKHEKKPTHSLPLRARIKLIIYYDKRKHWGGNSNRKKETHWNNNRERYLRESFNAR